VERPRIHFFVDENQPARLVSDMLRARGHRAEPVQVGTQDPAILRSADLAGAVIVTADKGSGRSIESPSLCGFPSSKPPTSLAAHRTISA